MGKARPWILRMCIPLAVTMILLFFVPQNFPSMMKYVYVFIMYNLVNTVCLTAIQVPFYSMISLLTRNSYERGFLGNIQQIFQTIGNIPCQYYFTIMLTKFSSADIYDAAGLYRHNHDPIRCYGCGVLISFLSTKERVKDTEGAGEAEEKREKVSAMTAVKSLLSNKYWVMMFFAMLHLFIIIFYSIGGVYYAIYIFGDMGQISWMNNAISIAQFAVMFATPFFMKSSENVRFMRLECFS